MIFKKKRNRTLLLDECELVNVSRGADLLQCTIKGLKHFSLFQHQTNLI